MKSDGHSLSPPLPSSPYIDLICRLNCFEGCPPDIISYYPLGGKRFTTIRPPNSGNCLGYLFVSLTHIFDNHTALYGTVVATQVTVSYPPSRRQQSSGMSRRTWRQLSEAFSNNLRADVHHTSALLHLTVSCHVLCN